MSLRPAHERDPESCTATCSDALVCTHSQTTWFGVSPKCNGAVLVVEGVDPSDLFRCSNCLVWLGIGGDSGGRAGLAHTGRKTRDEVRGYRVPRNEVDNMEAGGQVAIN
ncbi:hypothetical protein CSPAE12_06695 [Colletotrichum incanum]|nr:hypothetical protein CSPAE12_06695 [Colletotrichum incanum]